MDVPDIERERHAVENQQLERRVNTEQDHPRQAVLLHIDRSIVFLILALPQSETWMSNTLGRYTKFSLPLGLGLQYDGNVCLWHTSEEEDDLEELPDEQHPIAPPPVRVLYDEPAAAASQGLVA